jgi:GTP 3',8-cyclase
MKDGFGREITYLRISVTDRCNFRCRYCMPEQGIEEKPHSDILRYEEILRIAKQAVRLGVTSIRVTGGEPLVRRGLVEFIRGLSLLRSIGLQDISLTTNGSLLAGMAADLRAAGLDRVNVSLDTLDPDRFHEITRSGDLYTTLHGIRAAIATGLEPVKINAVATRSANLDEIIDFAYLAWFLPVEVRFIELMPLGDAGSMAGEMISALELREALLVEGTLTSLERSLGGAGPAGYYGWRPRNPSVPPLARRAIETITDRSLDSIPHPSGAAKIGFIASVSEHFCPDCNRLRLTSDGKLNPCLWSTDEIDVRSSIRAGSSDEELSELILEAARSKPVAHGQASTEQKKRRMSRLGG